MKNRKLLMRVKAHTNSLFFNGCKWSMLITAYALIAIIIVMSSESHFSEGVYAAEVEYSKETFDFTEAYENNESEDVLCMSPATTEEDAEKAIEKQPADSVQGQMELLSSRALAENSAKSLVQKQNAAEQVNVNIMDSVANDKTKKMSNKKKTKKDSVEAFNSAEDGLKIQLSSSEKNILMRIVEAEATGEDIKGKMLVANVVMNRVNSGRFPDSVEEVVFQQNGSVYQFSPIKDGRYYEVSISKETKKAVNRVLKGEDESKGALFFMSRSRAKASSVTWFDRSLTKVFKYGTHEFYK